MIGTIVCSILYRNNNEQVKVKKKEKQSHHDVPLVFKLFAVLVLFVPLLSVVFAQEDEKGDASSSLLLTKYNALREEGQGFFLQESSNLHQKTDSTEESFVALEWWCDLEFSSDDADTIKYGYVGRAVGYFLGSSLEGLLAQGGQTVIPSNRKVALSVSAVLVPTLGIFEGQIHATHDDWVYRYWDDGSSTLPILGWEGHDEGDTDPNTDTSAWSGSGTITKITKEEAAKYLGMNVVDMTPATCSMEYEASWNATNVLNPFDNTKVTPLEEELLLCVVTIEESLVAAEKDVAQLQADNKELQADNKELLLLVASIEESLAAAGAKNTGSGKSTKKQKKKIQNKVITRKGKTSIDEEEL